MSDTIKFLLILYASGFVLSFIIGVISLIPGLFSYNSIHQQNLRLILCRISVLGKTEDYEEPKPHTFKNAFKEFGVSVVLHLFSSLFSWIQVAITSFVYVKFLISWVFTPPAIRLYRWKVRNIPFHRAEDLIKFSQEAGYTTQSEKLLLKSIDEISKKSEALTATFAKIVFKDEKEADSYVREALRLSKEDYDSVVVNPRFWAIHQNEFSARFAINSKGGGW